MKIILHEGEAHPGREAPLRTCVLSAALILAHPWPRTPADLRFCSTLNLQSAPLTRVRDAACARGVSSTFNVDSDHLLRLPF